MVVIISDVPQGPHTTQDDDPILLSAEFILQEIFRLGL
jgi:hypothetical protein